MSSAGGDEFECTLDSAICGFHVHAKGSASTCVPGTWKQFAVAVCREDTTSASGDLKVGHVPERDI